MSPIQSSANSKKSSEFEVASTQSGELSKPDERQAAFKAPALSHATIQDVSGDGESFDNVPKANRRIGLFSAVFILLNRIIGTGIFATPASIVQSTGSIGLSLILWVVGSLIAAAGTAVYLEWATAIPRSGGEKNYLEHSFRKPLYLITCMYAAYAALLGWPSGNSVYAGEMLLNAAGTEVTRWNQRAIGVGVVTFALLLHGLLPKWGLRLQNVLGIFKVGVLLFIIIAGFVALGGHVKAGVPEPSNFKNAFAGSKSDANAFVSALYNVIWSFIGYSNIFYAISEVRDPIRTVKRAAPLAVFSVSIIYMLVNIAFFAAVPKDVIMKSERLIAAEFATRMFDNASAGTAISVIIALSAIGNVLAVLFGQGRVNQELGREGVLPFSKFFASNKPFNAPFAGLGLQWAVTLIIILAPPGGDAYSFLLNLISYPLNIFNTLISFGLLMMYLRPKNNWKSPVRATLPVVIFFFLANLFLLIAPLVPPAAGAAPYSSLPYWSHVVVGFGIVLAGGVYYLVWALLLPKVGGYTLEREVVVGDDGISRNVFHHAKLE